MRFQPKIAVNAYAGSPRTVRFKRFFEGFFSSAATKSFRISLCSAYAGKAKRKVENNQVMRKGKLGAGFVVAY